MLCWRPVRLWVSYRILLFGEGFEAPAVPSGERAGKSVSLTIGKTILVWRFLILAPPPFFQPR